MSVYLALDTVRDGVYDAVSRANKSAKEARRLGGTVTILRGTVSRLERTVGALTAERDEARARVAELESAALRAYLAPTTELVAVKSERDDDRSAVDLCGKGRLNDALESRREVCRERNDLRDERDGLRHDLERVTAERNEFRVGLANCTEALQMKP